MSGWSGFWIGLAIVLVGMSYVSEAGCAVGIQDACDKVSAYYRESGAALEGK